jgi:sialic acid synthase SpsE
MYDGISDHFPQVLSSLIGAVVLMAHGKKDIYIERHVTISHDFETIDREVSIDFNQLADLKHYLTIMEQMMG